MGSTISSKYRTEMTNEHECTLPACRYGIEECSKLCIFFVVAQILLKIDMKPETALLGVEGEEEKCTYSFHIEKQVSSESRVSGSSVPSDEALQK